MNKVNAFSAPKEVQRAALKWLAGNNVAHSSVIAANIVTPGGRLWNIGQNLSVLKKNKLVTRNPSSGFWTITTSGMAQARAWMISDGDTTVDEEPQPEYVWQIAVVTVKGATEKTKMDSDWEAFAADHVGAASANVIYFRKLVEK